MSRRPKPWPEAPDDAAMEALRAPPIVLGQADRARLTSVAMDALLANPRAAAPLLREIGRAVVVDDDAVPVGVARLGASVEYVDMFAGRVERVVLVATPGDTAPGTLSVLTSAGAGLIGLSEGQTILWRDHIGLELLMTVSRVDYRPESRNTLSAWES